MALSDLGKVLKQRRQALKLTQQELADKIHISNQYVSEFETEKSYPSMEFLQLLVRILDFSVDSLLVDDPVLSFEERDTVEQILRANTAEKREIILETAKLLSAMLIKNRNK